VSLRECLISTEADDSSTHPGGPLWWWASSLMICTTTTAVPSTSSTNINLPCIALEYCELHQFTTFCRNEVSFLGACFQVFDNARELGLFRSFGLGRVMLRHCFKKRPCGCA
jgi:hypothetical protein